MVEFKFRNWYKKEFSIEDIINWFHNIIEPPVRTLSQNKALHLWFTQISELLNDAGQVYTNEMGIECRYTMLVLKNVYWKPLLYQLFEIESTKEMTTTILNNLIDSFTLWFAQKKGIEVPPFPNLQILLNKLDAKNV